MQFTSKINIVKTQQKNQDFDGALRNVVCVGLYALTQGEIKDQSLFYNLNNDLYTVNFNVIITKEWNVATSINLNLYKFNASKSIDLY